MKHKIGVRIIAFILAAAFIIMPMYAMNAQAYEHDPRLNPSVMQDIIVDPDAVYGFSPSPESARLGEYVKYDWGDEELVENARQERIQYHESIAELYVLKDQLVEEGKSIEEIARAVSTQRNVIRLRAYDGDPERLASVKASNLETYGNEFGPTPDSLYEKYGSWETVLEKAFSANAAMDACLGLYDDYYDLYVMLGQIEEEYYTDALAWAYANGITEPITIGVYEPMTECTRAEAAVLLWGMFGAQESEETGVFNDVEADAYYAEAVNWAAENDIMIGIGNGKFAPDAVLTRAQLVTIISRSANIGEQEDTENPFEDVSPDTYYLDAVKWAYANEIVKGTSSKTFSPRNGCTRADALTILWRYSRML